MSLPCNGARTAAAAVLLAALLLATGCTTRDDETAPAPRATTTVSPSAAASTPAAPRPGTVPFGEAGITPDTPVWAQGSVLHVGQDRVDVAPRRIDAFVVTRGGVYFLDRDELWFTDLSVVRAAAITGVTALVPDRVGAGFRVRTQAGTTAYDAGSGRRVAARFVDPPTATDRLGTPGRLALRSERSDVSPSAGEVPVRMGAGKFGLVDVEGGPLVAFDTTYDLRVPLTGVVGRQFELVSWTGEASFYGLALESGRPVAVLGCELTSRSCRSYRVDPGESLLFQSGT